MEDEDVEYLRPGFDPSSLTVARLRNLLVRHDIPYTASAKKSQLVETFSSELAPRARKILAARARTQRTSRGITDMPSSQEASTDGDDDGDAALPPARLARSESPRKRSSRSVRQSTTETLEDGPAPKKTPGRKPRQPRISDEGEDAPPETPLTVRRSRVSEPPPQVKVELSSPSKRTSGASMSNRISGASTSKRTSDAESVFSDENPFQSGGSPPTEGRRRSSGVRKEHRSSSQHRRTSRTPAIKEEDDAASSSRTIEFPTSRLSGSRVKRELSPFSALEPGEEFTLEEQDQLLQESAMNGVVDVLPPRRRAAKRSGGVAAVLWPVFLSVLIGCSFLYRKEKMELGYCGVGKPTTALEEYEAPEWLSFLQPQCEPCPAHATCFSDMRIRCDQDFLLKPHPLSVGGALPVPPTCEPDGEKVRKVHAVAEKAVEELRERRAKYECGELAAEGAATPTVEIAETKLKAQVSQKRRRGMSEAEFEELWKGAIGEVLSRDEVTSSSQGNPTNALSSSSLARLPIGCAIRRSARLAVARHRVEVGGVILALVLALAGRQQVRARRQAAARVPELVAAALDRLATEAALHSRGAQPDPWISSGRLRDDVLRAEFSAARREDIWRRVARVVEVNANVRASVREDRNGEVSRVWEWIGSLPALEDGSGVDDRRRSGRPSLLPAFEEGATPGSQRSSTPAAEGGVITDTRKWDEGRPIY